MSSPIGNKLPILYFANFSPPVRAVVLVAKELGIELELKSISLPERENRKPEYLKMNPQGTVPLLDDNGIYIYDSHVICGYLSDKYSPDDDRLYSKDLVKRAQINARLFFDSGHIFCRLRYLFEPIFLGETGEMELFKTEYIQKCWPIMEEFLRNQMYVCGNEMTIADFCCVATISSICFAAPIDAEKYPKLIGWMKRMAALPYYEEFNVKGTIELKEIVLRRLQQNQAALSEKTK